MVQPLVQAITYQNPAIIFSLFINQPYAIFLDSAKQFASTGRYSFIGFDPFSMLTSKNNITYLNDTRIHENIFAMIKTLLNQYQLESLSNLPPFQGGSMGYFGYDLCHQLENIPHPKKDDMQFADLILGFYDVILAFDHQLKKAWIFSSGYPEQIEAKRIQRAQKRLNTTMEILHQKTSTDYNGIAFCDRNDIQSSFSEAGYMQAVSRVIDYIHAGDIFQANISQRFHTSLQPQFSPWQLYQKLRKLNPAPFAAYLGLGDTVIASASPERFIHLKDQQVETRPIKGTRPRSTDPIVDAQNAESLINSEKDRAENIMIVDLLRNDLSKVCLNHSVQVAQLCSLESYETVHHLTSVIQGKLAPENYAIDLLKASFPGGSITGAPKIRAMQIIYEIESHRRGPYCGCIGYIGFDGTMDTSITIRTFCIKNNIITFQTGGAVVADSDPYQEYVESMVKAQSLINALITCE